MSAVRVRVVRAGSSTEPNFSSPLRQSLPCLNPTGPWGAALCHHYLFLSSCTSLNLPSACQYGASRVGLPRQHQHMETAPRLFPGLRELNRVVIVSVLPVSRGAAVRIEFLPFEGVDVEHHWTEVGCPNGATAKRNVQPALHRLEQRIEGQTSHTIFWRSVILRGSILAVGPVPIPACPSGVRTRDVVRRIISRARVLFPCGDQRLRVVCMQS